MKLFVQFLGLYGAADLSAQSKVEWPPHPDRLYQALVDSALPADRAALAWIETQPAPGVDCGGAASLSWGVSGQVFVPTNYMTDGLPELRSKQPRTFPMAMPDGDGLVSYVWQADPPAPVFESICRTVGRATHVGRSDSVALFHVETGVAPCRWTAQANGPLAMRVPCPGRLAQLESAFLDGQRSPTAPPIRYGNANTITHAGPWQDMVVMRLPRPIYVGGVVDATDALRRAVMSKLGNSAPAMVHGHTDGVHMAWVGLPNLGDFGDEDILGLAMVVPKECDPLERARCISAMLSVNHIKIDGWRFGLERPTAAMSLNEKTWSKPSRHWTTATPVVLDRYPKKSQSQTIGDMVALSCELAGYPRPIKVEWSEHSELKMPRSDHFSTRKKGALFGHVKLEFAHPVQGPVLIGKERFFGLGLFLPVFQEAREPQATGSSPGRSRGASSYSEHGSHKPAGGRKAEVREKAAF